MPYGLNTCGTTKPKGKLNHELSERQKTQMALMLTLEHQQKLAEIAARMEGSPGKIPPDYMRLQKSLEQEANKTTNK